MIETLYKNFRHWSSKGSVYLVSDTHFFDHDRKVMNYAISEQKQIIILKKYCHKNDTLIHLGDVGDPSILSQLKCHKVLIMGNHDETATKFEPYFDEIYTGPLFIAEKLVLSHEPINVESLTKKPIAFNIHGHDHSGEFKDYCHLNLAQNVFGYKPLNLKKFIQGGNLKRVKSIHREIIDTATNYRR